MCLFGQLIILICSRWIWLYMFVAGCGLLFGYRQGVEQRVQGVVWGEASCHSQQASSNGAFSILVAARAGGRQLIRVADRRGVGSGNPCHLPSNTLPQSRKNIPHTGEVSRGYMPSMLEKTGRKVQAQQKVQFSTFWTWEQSYTIWVGYHQKICSMPRNISSACITKELDSGNLFSMFSTQQFPAVSSMTHWPKCKFYYMNSRFSP